MYNDLVEVGQLPCAGIVNIQVFMLDPWSASSVELVEYVKLFLEHMVPARLGLVLLPDPESEVGVAVCQGFAYLSVKYSPKEGLRWLVKVACGLVDMLA